MSQPKERILIVDNDPDTSDVIARQTLQPLGYQVGVVSQAAQAIREAIRFSPDVIIANLKLPGLSGKDLLVALAAQNTEIPVILLAQRGQESDIIQAFRLGATDYLLWPAREAEILSVVERALKQVRARREREQLASQLNQANASLQQRIRELTTIFAVGKAVISVTDQRTLFDKIVEGAVYVTEADSGWLLLRQDPSKNYILSAQRNLPTTVTGKLNQPWDDGISSLVGLSGESLSIYGEPLKRFKVYRLAQSVLVTPIKVRNEVIGLLVVARKAPRPFTTANQALLQAVGDYASISIVNARLFRLLEERAKSLQKSVEVAQAREKGKDEIFLLARHELEVPLKSAIDSLLSLLIGEENRLNATQKSLLRATHDTLQRALNILKTLAISDHKPPGA